VNGAASSLGHSERGSYWPISGQRRDGQHVDRMAREREGPVFVRLIREISDTRRMP
jgi:hypothetical protein